MIKKRYVILISVFFFMIAGVVFLMYRYMPLARTDFSSFAEFKKAGARGYLEMPSGARDLEYYLDYPILYMHSIYSFTLTDETAYDTYMEKIKDYSCNETSASYPAWTRYKDYNYTPEEREEMQYVEENYMNMSYTELLPRSKHNKGFGDGYGAEVEDYLNLQYDFDNFPIEIPFEQVISDSIQDYTILYYKPSGVGYRGEGILVNEETKRFVVFYISGLR